MTPTRKLIAATVVGGALLTGSLVSNAPAHADISYYYPSGSKGDQSVAGYYHDLTAEGIATTYSSAAGQGASICQQLREGHSETTLVAIAMTADPQPTVGPTLKRPG